MRKATHIEFAWGKEPFKHDPTMTRDHAAKMLRGWRGYNRAPTRHHPLAVLAVKRLAPHTYQFTSTLMHHGATMRVR